MTSAHREAVLESIGRSVIGPTLTYFAAWHLRRFEEVGVRTALYIAREGRLMLDVANAAFPATDGTPTRVYARLSRRIAWGALIPSPEEAFSSRIGRSRIRTVRAALDTVPFHPDLKAAVVSRAGLELDAPLSAGNLGRLQQAARAHADGVASDVQAQRVRLARYARAMGAGQGPVGIVDIGWSCSIQDALALALHGSTPEPGAPDLHGGIALHGAYLGVHQQARRQERSSKAGFIHDPAAGGPRIPLLEAGGALRALETVLSSDERSAYRLVDAANGAIDVELAPYGPSPQLVADRAAVRRGALRFAQETGPQLRELQPAAVEDLRRRAHELVSRFVEAPTPDEARAVLGMQYIQDVGVGVEEPIGWAGVSVGTAWFPALVAQSHVAQRAASRSLSWLLDRRSK